MARQKKIIPGVPNTQYPKDTKGAVKILWASKDDYTWDQLTSLMTEALSHRGYEGGPYHGASNPAEYYTSRLLGHMGANPNIEDWKKSNSDGDGPYYNTVRFVLERAWVASKEFKKINDAFLEEYNNRPDMQEFYKEFAVDQYYFYDVWGNHYYESTYNEPTGESKLIIESEKNAPSSYMSYKRCMSGWKARQFLEKNRPTAFAEGDLVVLRDVYVDHPDHDPLWLSYYERMRQNTTVPDKSTLRIGTVMKVTDNIPYRATRGCKLIDILWIGKDASVHVPEKVLKFYERPTYKNGLKKRES
jgi:hypothetical protein